MQISERERLALYEKARVKFGEVDAGTLMELLPPTGWGDFPNRADMAALGTSLRGEMAEVRGEMAEVRGEMAEVRGEMAEVRGEMASLASSLRGEMTEVRADLIGLEGRLDLRLADQTRSMQYWIAGSTISIWLSILLQNAFN